MLPVSSWFQPHVYQMIKLTLVTVSLVGVLTSTLAMLAQCVHSSGHDPCCWLCHPTPLLLVELSLMLSMSQVSGSVIIYFWLPSPVCAVLLLIN